ELKLHSLKLSDGFAELLALAHVIECGIKRSLSNAEHLCADPDATFVQRLNRNLVTLSDFAEHTVLRYLDVLQHKLARTRGANTEFVLLLPDSEPRLSSLDQKRGNAAITL